MIPCKFCIPFLGLILLTGCVQGNANNPAQPTDPRPGESITHITDRTELFVEFRSFVQDQDSPLAAHLTRLDTFKAREQGRVIAVLAGGGAPEERFEIAAPQVPGIFRPVVTPQHAGPRQLTLVIESDAFSDRHDLGTVTVFPDVAAAIKRAEASPPAKGNTITFLKEQQWRMDFATAVVATGSLRGSVTANGVLRARSDGEVYVTAPTTGRLITAGDDFLRIGMKIDRDQVLVTIASRLGNETDLASLELALERARLGLEHAKRERTRIEALFQQGAIAEKRVIEARHEAHVAQAEMAAAQRRMDQYRRVQQIQHADGPGGIAVRSPIAGTVARVDVAPGAFVEEGQKLFHIVDLDRLWLEVQVPEANIGRVQGTTGAWLEIDGFEAPFEVSPPTGGRVIALGGVIDPESRTVPLLFEVPNSDRVLRVGLSVRAHILTGETAPGPVVPLPAIVDDNGQEVAYVQVEGEAFERRSLRLGVRDGDRVEVLEGLRPGERVVTRGAYLMRLAASSSAVPAHGHAH
jgi:membrane fusion protein, heavy metal efflux system